MIDLFREAPMIILNYAWLLIALALMLWGIGGYIHWVHQRYVAARARRHREQATATAAALRGEVTHLLSMPYRNGEYSDGG